MNCLRCGLKMENDGAFCPKCAALMDKEPVDLHARVILPKQRNAAPVRTAKIRSPEETVQQQKKTIRMLAYMMIVLLLLIAVLSAVLFLNSDKKDTPPIGQNYSAETSNTTIPQ